MLKEEFLEKADSKFISLIGRLEEYIKGSQFEELVYLVGGCVRDSIMGHPIMDIDIVVEDIDGGKTFANFLAVKDGSFENDKNPKMIGAHQTFSVKLLNDPILKDYDIECSDSRNNVNTVGMTPKDRFGTIFQDCLCRDLSVNSLYYSITDKAVYDICGTSFNDIENEILRCPGKASDVFKKDPIKIMRAIRFSTEFVWGIEKNTWFAMVENSKYLTTVPIDRIRKELTKILCCMNGASGLKKMIFCGALKYTLPSIYQLRKEPYKDGTLLGKTIKAVDKTSPYIEHRLAALFHMVGTVDFLKDEDVSNLMGEIITDEISALGYSNSIVKSVTNAIVYSDYFKDINNPTFADVKKFVNLLGYNFTIALDLMSATADTSEKVKKAIDIIMLVNKIEKIDSIINPKLPVNGDDIINAGAKGKMIGYILTKIKNMYFENENITKEECLEIARRILSK